MNRLRPGRILRKIDPNGVPLAGACFDLVEDGAGASCTDENGELLFAALVPGVYSVMETEAPAGYLVAPAIDPVTVRPGSTATLDVVNQPAPPPPDSGSIQVRKFVCPVLRGVAASSSSTPPTPMVGWPGPPAVTSATRPLSSTDRRADRVPHRIRRPLPDDPRHRGLRADRALDRRVGAADGAVNTLTTVVVINYVEPEGEQPAAIDVVKYTCAPGFQGRVWLDFAEACLDDANLTNNVGFRLSGAVSARRVTGDTGIGGATRFDGLPSGDYRLREETRWAPSRSTPSVASIPSPTGAEWATRSICVCLRPDRHLSLVQRAGGPRRGYRGDHGLQVRLSRSRSRRRGSIGMAAAIRKARESSSVCRSGMARDSCRSSPGRRMATAFFALPGCNRAPMTCRRSTPPGAAESDSVNAQGQVVVAAGERASVWIFNCVGAKNPPNTGAGPGP